MWACLILPLVFDSSIAARADARSQEAERASRTAARIEAEWPLVGPGPATDFVRALGARLGQTAGPTPFGWKFVVFRHHAAQAFSIGGGRIYLSDGAIEACVSEAELAAIMAHEMGHELAGHFRGERASTPRRRARSHHDADVRIGSVTQQFDPPKEIEADRVSIRILQAAGYALQPALDIARRMSRQSTNGAAAFDQHRLDALAAQVGGAVISGRTDSSEFQSLRRQLLQADPR